MTFTIPVWLLWLIGIPLALAVLFFAVMGFWMIMTLGNSRR